MSRKRQKQQLEIHRNTQIQLENLAYSLSDDEENSYRSFEEHSFRSNTSTLGRSLPDLSTRLNDEVEELKQKIQDLSLQLESAHLEIETLTLEKNGLLETISQQDIKINTLKAMNAPSPTITIKKKKNKSTTLARDAQTTHDGSSKNVSSPVNKVKKIPMEKKPEEMNNLLTSRISEGKKNVTTFKDSNKIYIYGSQQCTGLASALLKSRINNKYEKYEVFAETKPNATTEEILKSCHNTNTTSTCKVILCIGENDTNPTKVITELSAALNKFKNCNVLVLNTLYSHHLNEYYLNKNLRIICNSYSNCHFVETSMSCYNYLSNVCKKINFYVDSLDYERLYLNVNIIKRRLQLTDSKFKNVKHNREPKLQQKTILHYFSKKQEVNPLNNTFFRQ